MFVLDTNILSAIMESPAGSRGGGMDCRPAGETLFTTTICQAEILSGLAVMPKAGAARP